jgi:hypothetical protein
VTPLDVTFSASTVLNAATFHQAIFRRAVVDIDFGAGFVWGKPLPG